MHTTIATRHIQESRKHGAASILDHEQLIERNELSRLVGLAQAGDERAKTRACLAITPYAMKVAKRYYLMWLPKLPDTYHYDDAYASALEGIVKALNKFDPLGENSFTGYAHLWIQTTVQRSIYAAIGIGTIPEARIGSMNLDDPMLAHQAASWEGHGAGGGDDDEDMHLPSRIGELDASYRNVDEDDSLRYLMAALYATDRRLPELARRLAAGDSTRQCSIDLGIPTRTIDELLVKAQAALTIA